MAQHSRAQPDAGSSVTLCKPASFSLCSLMGTILLYGVFGTPTPDHPGWVEIALALLLFAAVGPARLAHAILPVQQTVQQTAGHTEITRFTTAARPAFLYGMCVPLVAGLAYGQAPVDIVRDAIAFLFLFMPLLLAPLMARLDTGECRALVFVTALAGTAMALRHLIPYIAAGLEGAGAGLFWLVSYDRLEYLANSPLVLFTAFFLTAAGLEALRLANRPADLGRAVVYLAAGCCAVTAMASMLQRAGLAALLLAAGLYLLWYSLKSPARLWRIALLLIPPLMMIWPWLESLGMHLILKTTLVGVNNRLAEAGAVFAVLGDNPLTLIFGLGWGADFENPAVGGMRVAFTHNIFTAMLLKTGLAGTALILAYGVAILRLTWPLASFQPFLYIAAVLPLGIVALFYASFKSLGFGIVLLLLVGGGCHARRYGA